LQSDYITKSPTKQFLYSFREYIHTWMDLKEVLPVCSHYFFIWCLPTNKVVQLIRFNHHKLVRNSLFLSWNILFSWLEHVLLAIQSPRDTFAKMSASRTGMKDGWVVISLCYPVPCLYRQQYPLPWQVTTILVRILIQGKRLC
jgi:hypothetical protein